MRLLALFLLIAVAVDARRLIVKQAADPWDYERVSNTGPNKWYLQAPNCAGRKQSPIDIPTKSAVYDANLTPLRFQYGPILRNVSATNSHFTSKATIPAGNLVSGGALKGTYQVAQFHFHANSEHSVDGFFSQVEFHIVHTLAAADSGANATPLAVVGVFLQEQVDAPDNAAYESLVDTLAKTLTDNYVVPEIDLNGMLPANRNYYTYQGSLTTPDCSETVTWHVLPEPVVISSAQMGELLRFTYDSNPYGNARPVQPLNGRVVRTNIKPATHECPAPSPPTPSGSTGSNVVNINFAGLLNGIHA